MNILDRLLNRTTMYRLAIIVLGGYIALATVLGWFGVVHLDGTAILVDTVLFLFVCWLANRIFAWAFGVPSHGESALITALILTLLVPPTLTRDGIMAIGWIAVVAIAGKYIVAWKRQHLFNPAALAVAITGVAIAAPATWWVSNTVLLPFVVIGGFLIIRKLQKEKFVLLFLAAVLCGAVISSFIRHASFGSALHEAFLISPTFFFATVMLTEPATMPGSKYKRYLYAVLIGILFTPQIHVGGIYSTPELALLAGNAFVFVVNLRKRYVLRLVGVEKVGKNIKDFVFASDPPIRFRPGQYVELMAAHAKADARGRRRYFTIASAPEEEKVRFGVKFSDPSSTYKRALLSLKKGNAVFASQLGGDFTLPKDPEEKLVFIAGGIGVTPFRSMVADLLLRKEHREITLFYSAQDPEEFAYWNIFNYAAKNFGMALVYTITNPERVPSDWHGERGSVSGEMIQKYVADIPQQRFYLSGPHGMVLHFQKTLKELGVPRRQIVSDFFPGFA